MRTLHSLGVLAALSFIGAACAQTETPAPNGPSATVTHPTANPELDGASTASRGDRQRLATASSPTDGMQVRSESGELLGRIASVIPGDARNESYVVVGDLQGLAVMMPYATASAMTQHDKMVVDRTAFEKAPKVQETQVEDHSLEGSQRKADEYWKRYAMREDSTGPVRR
jgi:hypothetical protein